MNDFDQMLARAVNHLKSRTPFVMYAKPDAAQVAALFQTDKKKYLCANFGKEGFAFADFAGNAQLLIPADASEVALANIQSFPATPDASQKKSLWAGLAEGIRKRSERQNFEALALGAIKAIQAGKYSKLVVSRKEHAAVPGLDWKRSFAHLLWDYPHAFRYAFYHPEAGFWMGASPERLLKVTGNAFDTVALAGTQVYEGSDTVAWGEKEKAEQRFVTDYIIAELRGKISAVEVSEPYTARAGNLMHIKTDISGVLNESEGVAGLLAALHPTPAVCGLPKHESFQYLLKHEGYDREFYSGFLGEIGHGVAEFYVNLRCMKVAKGGADIFVGCGITQDSNPILEFAETENKTLTMKNILYPQP